MLSYAKVCSPGYSRLTTNTLCFRQYFYDSVATIQQQEGRLMPHLISR